MGHVKFDNLDNVVAGHYSKAKGPVLRSDKQEVTRVTFAKGEGAAMHHHPEEQTFYIVKGKLRVWLGDDEPYDVGPDEASFHPSNVPHGVEALEDTLAISFKNVVDPTGYAPTGSLT
ncbi:MAG: cupin domain-containing protein [Streptosporangiales bacterium]|nr:cupin domain-containing protein [Streptosporangiales bacterium]